MPRCILKYIGLNFYDIWNLLYKASKDRENRCSNEDRIAMLELWDGFDGKCSFPTVAITKYSRFRGLAQEKLTPSQLWRAEVWNQMYQRSHAPSGLLRPLPSPPPTAGGPRQGFPWLVAVLPISASMVTWPASLGPCHRLFWILQKHVSLM